jgi:hypothetical protein
MFSDRTQGQAGNLRNCRVTRTYQLSSGAAGGVISPSWRQDTGGRSTMEDGLMMLKTALGLATGLVAVLSTTTLSAQTVEEIATAAKAEGMLTTIALPHDWCGYGDVIAGFKAKYPEINVNELNPDAGSGDEIEAIKANKDNKGPQAPDVIDVGLAYGPSAKAEGLIQPLQGCDLGRDPRQRQGCGRPLVRRLLRRDVLPGEQGPGGERAAGLGRSSEAGICRSGCAGGRPAGVEPGDPRRCWPRACRPGLLRARLRARPALISSSS